MSKDKVSEWSSIAANNTDIAGINIAEGCAPSGINNAIRELMAQVKDMQAGTDSDNFTVGGNLTVTGTTTLTGAATAPTPSASDDSTKIATTAFVKDVALPDTSGNGIVARTGALTVANRTITAGTGITVTNGDGVSGNPTIAFANPLTLGTSQSASGSSIDFTGIPSWVKRITVMIAGVSTAAAGTARIRIGTSSGIVTTGYVGGNMTNTQTPTNVATSLSASPEGLGAFSTTDGNVLVNGTYVITNVTGNTWISSGMVYRTNDGIGMYSNAYIALGGTLDRVSVVATTSTFDAGTVNIIYE